MAEGQRSLDYVFVSLWVGEPGDINSMHDPTMIASVHGGNTCNRIDGIEVVMWQQHD